MCDIRALLKSSYGPLSVYVSPPLPLGHKWRLIGGSDIKQLPHHGAFDKQKLAMSNPHHPIGSYIRLYWGI